MEDASLDGRCFYSSFVRFFFFVLFFVFFFLLRTLFSLISHHCSGLLFFGLLLFLFSFLTSLRCHLLFLYVCLSSVSCSFVHGQAAASVALYRRDGCLGIAPVRVTREVPQSHQLRSAPFKRKKQKALDSTPPHLLPLNALFTVFTGSKGRPSCLSPNTSMRAWEIAA